MSHQNAQLEAADQPQSVAGGAAPLAGLETRLQHFAKRDIGEALQPFVRGQRVIKRDQPAWAERGDLAHIFVIESGWAYKFDMMHDGRRHIADFFGPGAICNWSRLSRFEEQDDILFKAGARLTLLDTTALDEHLRENAALASAFKRHELARTMRTTQRIRTFISLPAMERMLVLLLDLADELGTIAPAPSWITIPFAQSEVADMLGLTPVHVSRVLKKLVDNGVLERDGHEIRFVDRATVARDLAYRPFFKSRAG